MHQRLRGFRSIAGRFARRLSPTARLIDRRMGPLADSRATIHERLDTLERYGAHLAEQGDRNTRATVDLGNRVAKGFDDLRGELVDRIHIAVDPLGLPWPVGDAHDVAFAAASVADIRAGGEVLVVRPASVASALRILDLDVSAVIGQVPIPSGCRPLTKSAAASRTWRVVIALGEPGDAGEASFVGGLVGAGGLLVASESVASAMGEGWGEERAADGRRAMRRSGG